MSKILGCWAGLALLCGYTAESSPADPLDLGLVVSAMAYPGVDVAVEWQDCGEVNAYYDAGRHTVVMCNELPIDKPAVVRFVLAHELAHAVIQQLDIPYTTSSEGAADELATYTMLMAGWRDDVMTAADYTLQRNNPDFAVDPHPSDQRRALNMICLAQGSRGLYSPMCTVSWPRVVRAWNLLLRLD